MVKISYAYKKKKKREKKNVNRILLFHSEIGRCELQTL